MDADGLGAYIRNLRQRRGWTQRRLAEEIGTAPAYLSQIENGGTKLPSADLRRRLADALGVRHVDLLVAAGELEAEEIRGPQMPIPVTPPEMLYLADRLARVAPALEEAAKIGHEFARRGGRDGRPRRSDIKGP